MVSSTSSSVERNSHQLPAPISGTEKNHHPQDNLKAVAEMLADPVLTRFNASYWNGLIYDVNVIRGEHERDKKSFLQYGFPALVEYSTGKELKLLTTSQPWLNATASPSTRFSALAIFQEDPAHNLEILELFAKLKYLESAGKTFLSHSPLLRIYYELYLLRPSRRAAPVQPNEERGVAAGEVQAKAESKPVVSETRERVQLESESMREEFGTLWDDFVAITLERRRQKQPAIKAECPLLWTEELSKHAKGSMEIWETFYKQAMTNFLKRSVAEESTSPLRIKHVLDSWEQLNDRRNPEYIAESIEKEIWASWQAKSGWSFASHLRPDFTADIVDQVVGFCLAAGCSTIQDGGVFEYIEALRSLVGRQFAYTADLHKRIADLNKQIILQQRMITALAYRNVLESLSANVSGHKLTDKWKTFVDQIFAALENGTAEPKDYALAELIPVFDLEKKYDLHHFRTMAKDLYGTLSRTIHLFQPSKDIDQYTPMPGQFDPMQIAFMEALRPMEKNVSKTGETDWSKERARYPQHIIKAGTAVMTTRMRKQKKTPSVDSFDDELARQQDEAAGVFEFAPKDDGHTQGSESEDDESEEDDDDDSNDS